MALTGRQQRWDVVTGLLLSCCALASLTLARSAGTDLEVPLPSTAEQTLWVLAVALPLCIRRRHPIAVLVTCSIAFIGLQSRYVPESMMTSICLFLALYSAGAWGPDRRIAHAARVLVVASMFCWLSYSISATAWDDAAIPADAGTTSTGPLPPHLAGVLYVTLINILFFAAAWYFGDAAWAGARQREELTERTRELARERDESAHRAVLAERVRIARELHDVVAHHVSLMGVQAGAARRVLDRDPELTRRTLSGIEEAGRSAVTELERLLLVLRDSDNPATTTDPAAGVGELPQLVETTAGPGLHAGLTIVGTPRPLPAALSVSVHRIVQEALTNTLRHAGAGRVDVRLRYLSEAVEVEIVDDGRGRTGSTHGSGLGQVGMRERVALHGGELELGHRPIGGYRVRARFPLSPGTARLESSAAGPLP
jgi:signal transduction histidine kinase